jgi:malate/lactate dehydrogenase
MDRKVTVIGAGNVGGAVAQRLAEKGLSDIEKKFFPVPLI